MTYDCFTYNGEWQMLQMRLNILSPLVDKFIVVEAKTTFTGKEKPLYFSLHEKMFEKYWSKLEYFIIDEDYSKEELYIAQTSPNTQGAAHWTNEFLQKESIKKALTSLQDNDRVYIGDVDEIWTPYDGEDPAKLKLLVYAYYLNNRSNELFWGTLSAKYKDIKGECLNHLRSNTNIRTSNYYGWHFTSMGGLKEVKRKLDSSYTEESYNTLQVQELLPERVKKGVDYLGRPFSFQLDESEWPLYLKENKKKYQKLCL